MPFFCHSLVDKLSNLKTSLLAVQTELQRRAGSFTSIKFIQSGYQNFTRYKSEAAFLFCFHVCLFQTALHNFFSFFQQCPCLIWLAKQACKQLSARKNDALYWYLTDMPFLPHFSEKSPPSCIKFRACSKRWNFSRAEIALKLQVVYTCDLKLQSGCNKDCTENCIKNCFT